MKTMKKFTFGMAVLLGVSLFLAGCGDAEGGAAGAAGSTGAPGKNTGAITDQYVSASALAAWFYAGDIVTLADTVETVVGKVPAGKTLVVTRPGGTAVGDNSIDGTETLEIEAGGVVEVAAGATLNASYVSGAAGYLKGAGSVTGPGTVSLPYLGTDGALPAGGISYAAAGIKATKAVGSYITSAAVGSALGASDIAAIFGIDGGPASLTVTGVTDITADALPPQGKTLKLAGTNTLANGVTAPTVAGTLIVTGGASLATGASGTAITIDGAVTIETGGTLTLSNAGDTIATPAKVTNDGTIATKTVTETVLTALAGLSGSGTIKLGAGVTLTDALALTQDVDIGTGGSLTAPDDIAAPFTGGKKITISETGALDFGEADADLNLDGVTIVNGGTAGITTATVSTAALNAILAKGAGGKVASTGAVVGTSITVPDETDFTLTAATLTGDLTLIDDAALTTAGAVTVEGTLTPGTGAIAIGGALTIPDGGIIALANEAVVATAGGGSIAFGGGVTLGNSGSLTAGSAATVAGSSDGVAITGAIAIVGALAIPEGKSIALANGTSVTTESGGTIAFGGGGATLGNSSGLTAGSAATVAGSSTGVVINGTVTGTGGISLATGSKTLKVEAGTLTWGPVVISGTTSKSTTITSDSSSNTVTLNATSGLEIGIGGKITLTDDPLSFVASNPANLALVGEGDYTVGGAEVTLNAAGLHLPPEATLTFGANTGFIKGYAVADGNETEIWKIGGAAVAITSVDNAGSDGTGVVFSANAISGTGGESFTMGESLVFTIAADATCETDADAGNTVVELVGVIADVSDKGTITVTADGVLKLAADGGIFAKASDNDTAVYGNKVATESDLSAASALPAASSVSGSAIGYISSTGNGESDDTVAAGATITNSSTFVEVNVDNAEDSSTGDHDGNILVGTDLHT